MHHGQAVEMTELAKTRAQDPAVKEIAAKIDLSQGDEIRWMKQWLAERGVAPETMGGKDDMAGMNHDDMAGMNHDDMDHGRWPAWITPAWPVWTTARPRSPRNRSDGCGHDAGHVDAAADAGAAQGGRQAVRQPVS